MNLTKPKMAEPLQKILEAELAKGNEIDFDFGVGQGSVNGFGI